jgi:hypothetical protein
MTCSDEARQLIDEHNTTSCKFFVASGETMDATNKAYTAARQALTDYVAGLEAEVKTYKLVGQQQKNQASIDHSNKQWAKRRKH